jgi:hypothetical protein
VPSDPSGQSGGFDREAVLQVFRDLEAKGQLVRPMAELEEMNDADLHAYAYAFDMYLQSQQEGSSN